MRNLTITVPEHVARWAKVWAARHDTSLSRLLGDLLVQLMEQEEGYDPARRQYLSRKPTALKKSGHYPRREDLHDRSGLR